MYPHHDRHAASVPVSSISVGIVWCHDCRAWRVHQWSVTTDGAELLVTLWDETTDLGPFDDEASVVAFVTERLTGFMNAPGGPWSRRSSTSL